MSVISRSMSGKRGFEKLKQNIQLAYEPNTSFSQYTMPSNAKDYVLNTKNTVLVRIVHDSHDEDDENIKGNGQKRHGGKTKKKAKVNKRAEYVNHTDEHDLLTVGPAVSACKNQTYYDSCTFDQRSLTGVSESIKYNYNESNCSEDTHTTQAQPEKIHCKQHPQGQKHAPDRMYKYSKMRVKSGIGVQEKNGRQTEENRMQCEYYELDKKHDTLNQEANILRSKVAHCSRRVYDCLNESNVTEDIETYFEQEHVEKLVDIACRDIVSYRLKYKEAISELDLVKQRLSLCSQQLEENNTRYKQEQENLQKKMKTIHNEHEYEKETLHHQIQELENYKEVAAREMIAIKEKMEADKKARDNEISKHFEMKKKEIEAELSLTNASLERVNETNQHMKTELQEVTQNYKDKLDELRSMNQKAQTDNAKLKTDLRACRVENDEAVRKCNELKELLSDKTIQENTRLSTLEDQNIGLKKECEQLQTELANRINDDQHLSRARYEMKEKVSEMERVNRELSEKNSSLKKEVTNQKIINEDMTEKLSMASKSNESQQTKIAALNKEIDVLKNRLHEQEDEWKQELRKIDTVAREQNESIIQHRTQTERENEEYLAEKEEVIERLNKEIETLKYKLHEQQDEWKEKLRKIDTVAKEQNENSVQHRKQIQRDNEKCVAEKEKVIQSLNEEIVRQKQLKHQTDVDLQMQVEELAQGKEKEIQRILEQKNEEIEQIKAKHVQTVAKYKSSLPGEQSKSASLENEKTKLVDEATNLQNNNERLSSLLAKRETTVSKLKRKNVEQEQIMTTMQTDHRREISLLKEEYNNELILLRQNISKLESQQDSRTEPGLQFEHASRSSEAIRRELAKTSTELNEAKNEINDLKNRLSQSMAQRLTDNNPNIADLSDKNRPTKLAERYTELYDNQWTDAYEVIYESVKGENGTINILVQILQESMQYCRQETEHQMQQLRSVVLMSDKVNQMPAVTNKQLKDCRKSIAETSSENAFVTYWEQLRTSTTQVARLSLKVPKYVSECFKLCWLMCVQDPPLVFGDDPGHKKPFSTSVYKAYTVSGTLVDFLVWPAMYLHQGGPLLSKGIAQGKDKAKRKR